MPAILIVEDDEHTAALLSKQLVSAGYEITRAKNGLEGLMLLEKARPAAIICDMMMPELGGLDFVKALKARDETRNLPVIFLTANTDPGLMINGINVGARYYLTKPYDPQELLWKLKRVIDPEASRGRSRTPDPRQG